MLQKLSYKPDIQNGVLVGVKRNSIVLSDEPVTGFDDPVQLQEYVKVRKIPTLVYRDTADPEEAAQQYAEYCSNLEAVAEPWEPGKVFKKHQARPISYDGKLYECIQGITVNDPNHTPDVTHAHYSEIQAPAGGGYPEWAQPTHAENSYAVGDRVTWAGKNWESTIPANTTEPGTLLPWNYWEEVME
jgi:hypothetical protein